jgi:hypothetical protein
MEIIWVTKIVCCRRKKVEQRLLGRSSKVDESKAHATGIMGWLQVELRLDHAFA